MRPSPAHRYFSIAVCGLALLACSIFDTGAKVRSLERTIEALTAQLGHSNETPTAEIDRGSREGDVRISSPNGFIAFVSGNRSETPAVSQGLYVIGPDGADAIRLGTMMRWYDSPTWSPDGRKIAFWSDVNGNRDIYVLDLQTHSVERLTDDPAWDISPSWSPDGDQIAFVSGRGGSLNIYVMDADGSGQNALTTGDFDQNYPSWSPDGERIAYLEEKGYPQLMLMESDGSGATVVAFAYGRAAWSPDGRFLAYAGFYDVQSGSPRQTNNPDIIVYDLQNDVHTRLTDNPGVDAFPGWSPNGAHLVYESDQDDRTTFSRSLYQISFNGPLENLKVSGTTRLTTGEARYAAWAPPVPLSITAPPFIQPAPPPSVRVCPSGCEFSSIQDAIDSAAGQLVVEVESGTYPGPLLVDKPVTLTGFDTGGGAPVIDVDTEDKTITIQASGVTLEGFHIINNAKPSGSSPVIYITSNHNSIIRNTFSCDSPRLEGGIVLSRANFNSLHSNDLGECAAISMISASYNQATANRMAGSSYKAILISSNADRDKTAPAHQNTARFNLVTQNSTPSIVVEHLSHENRVVSNSVSGDSDITGDPQSGALGRGGRNENENLLDGVILLNCGPMLNVVGANQVTNGSGIRLTSAGVFNMLIKNQVSGGSNGISLERAFFELVYGNRVSNVSGYGIYSGDWLYPMENQAGLIAESGGGHLLYRNTLIENKLNASDNWGDIYGVANIWDDGAFGNYFSDYDEPSEGCQDNDGNRICDTPFQIPGEPGGLDNYPVMDPIMD